MTTSFKVLARDGTEYGPAKVETILEWYRDGRIGNDSLACEARTLNWRRLDEIFDLSSWTSPNPDRTPAAPDYTARPPSQIAWDDEVRTSGMLWAAILLFINAAFSIAELLLVSFTERNGVQTIVGTFILTAGPTLDIIVGVGLLRGKWQFRQFAMIRAAAGLTLMVIAALNLQTPSSWVAAVFQIVFLAGMVALLYGTTPSRERIVAGVITVVFAWLGAAGGALVDVYFAPPREIPERAAVDKMLKLPGGMQIDDERDGYKLSLPHGWVLLQDNVARVAAPGATMAASNSEAGCFIALQVEALPSQEFSLDQYLTRLIESQKGKSPSMRELTRSAATLGEEEARRLETYWIDSGTPTRGFHTVCRKGASYYVLSGRCEESTYASAFAAFRIMETAFEVRGVKPDAQVNARRVRQGPPVALEGH